MNTISFLLFAKFILMQQGLGENIKTGPMYFQCANNI